MKKLLTMSLLLTVLGGTFSMQAMHDAEKPEGEKIAQGPAKLAMPTPAELFAKRQIAAQDTADFHNKNVAKSINKVLADQGLGGITITHSAGSTPTGLSINKDPDNTVGVVLKDSGNAVTTTMITHPPSTFLQKLGLSSARTITRIDHDINTGDHKVTTVKPWLFWGSKKTDIIYHSTYHKAILEDGTIEEEINCADGSKETRLTNIDGSSELQKKYRDGSIYELIINPDKSTKETKFRTDGSSTIVQKDKNGSTHTVNVAANKSSFQESNLADGSTRTIRVHEDGSKHIEEKNADGSSSTARQNADGSSHTVAIDKGGNKVDLKNNADGTFHGILTNADGSQQHKISDTNNNQTITDYNSKGEFQQSQVFDKTNEEEDELIKTTTKNADGTGTTVNHLSGTADILPVGHDKIKDLLPTSAQPIQAVSGQLQQFAVAA